MIKKIFSIPLNPKLTEIQFKNFVQFCEEYKEYIYDIYFTCRIPPFMQDAMGDIFTKDEDYKYAIDAALYIQNSIGISISATFNNIEVRPSQQNLDIWIKNFKPLYEQGIRSVTIPHTHWMATGQIQKEFPELLIKNTILRCVNTAADVALLAKNGFHYVNLERSLMRDRDTLLQIKKVKEKFNIKVSLLANEGCLGKCPMMPEHFQFNNTRTDGPQYFNDPISRVSCPKWDRLDPSTPLKTANIPPWRADWIDFIENLGIDVFKMHGRESIDRLFETMEIIKRFAAEEEFVNYPFDNFEKFNKSALDVWRDKIRVCKFDCWECHYCDSIVNVRPIIEEDIKVKMVANSLVDSVNKYIDISIPGLSSKRVELFLNELGKHSKKYLEIGSLLGRTASSVILNNNLEAYLVDSWKENTQPYNEESIAESSKVEFIKNIKKYNTNKNFIKVFDCDFLSVDKTELKDIDLFFYDGNHTEKETQLAVEYFSEVLADVAVLVFDDANWQGVVDGANLGIKNSNLKIIYDKKMLNDIEDKEQWWNGLYIVVVKRENV